MPIAFQTPAPLSPLVSYGMGAQHRADLDRQYQLQAQRQQQEAYEFQARPAQQIMLDQAHQQQRLAYEQQHIQQEFTISDKLEMERLQNQRSTVDQELRAGRITPGEADEHYQVLSQPLSVLQQRRAYWQAQAQKEQADQLKHQNAQQKAMEEEDLAISAGNAQANARPVYLDGQSPQDPGPDGQPLGAGAVPVGHMVHEIGPNGRTKRTFHPYKAEKPEKESASPPMTLNHPETGEPLPGLYQKKADGTYHLVPAARPERQPLNEQQQLKDLEHQRGVVLKEYQAAEKSFELHKTPIPDELATPELRDMLARKRHAENLKRLGIPSSSVFAETPGGESSPAPPAPAPAVAPLPKDKYTAAEIKAELRRREQAGAAPRLGSFDPVAQLGGY